jgi:predicted nucleic acid-binding protein
MVGRLMYLIDTNIWLELLLEQEKEEEVRSFFQSVEARLLSISDFLKQVIQVQQRYKLDFDDGYQYIAAEKNSYVIVSFDSDFDQTVLGRKTPREVMF